MVGNITSLTGNGLKDWLIQRVTALYLMIWLCSVLFCFYRHAPMDYVAWVAFVHNPLVAVSTVIALLAISLHAWIGLWTVTTDYLRCTVLRLSVQILILFVLLGQFVWSIILLWGRFPW